MQFRSCRFFFTDFPQFIFHLVSLFTFTQVGFISKTFYTHVKPSSYNFHSFLAYFHWTTLPFFFFTSAFPMALIPFLLLSLTSFHLYQINIVLTRNAHPGATYDCICSRNIRTYYNLFLCVFWSLFIFIYVSLSPNKSSEMTEKWNPRICH